MGVLNLSTNVSDYTLTEDRQGMTCGAYEFRHYVGAVGFVVFKKRRRLFKKPSLERIETDLDQDLLTRIYRELLATCP